MFTINSQDQQLERLPQLCQQVICIMKVSVTTKHHMLTLLWGTWCHSVWTEILPADRRFLQHIQSSAY